MREMIVSELSQAVHEIARGFAHYLPRLIVMLILAFVGWVIAYAVKVVVRGILHLFKFDKFSENTGASQLLIQGRITHGDGNSEPVRLLGHLARLHSAGCERARHPGTAGTNGRFFVFLPRLFVAMFILFFGLLAASFFSRAALLAAVNANVPSARIVSMAVRTVIIVFVFSVVFEELGIAEQTMLVAFGIAFGALMLGLAIAFGIGGRDLAQRFLEERFVRGRKEENEDELSPL